MSGRKGLGAVAWLCCVIVASGVAIYRSLSASPASTAIPAVADGAPVSPPAQAPSDTSESSLPQPSAPEQEDSVQKAPRIVVEEDFSLPEHRRKAVKVVISPKTADPDSVRSSLLEVARGLDADTVMVYGYPAGEDFQRAFPAGILEFGKDGKGWAPGADLPAEGVFKPREARHEGQLGVYTVTASSAPPSNSSTPLSNSNIEAATRSFIASEPPGKTVAEKNYDALVGQVSGRFNMPESTFRSLNALDQARLAVKHLADSLGITEDEALRMSGEERKEALIRHLSRKYGVSESDTRRAWQMLSEN